MVRKASKHQGNLQSGVPFFPPRKKKLRDAWGAYHLARKSRNFGLKSNGKIIFRKFRSFRGTPLFPFGTERRKFPYHLLNFPVSSLINRKQLREIEVQMVSAISFGWFADFGKTLTIIERSSQPVYSDKW